MARTKEFDSDEALGRAMDLFWRQGYATTSTEDLVKVMGIGRQSLYDTFGDKQKLYFEALRRYHSRVGTLIPNQPGARQTALDTIRGVLMHVIDRPREMRERGCMGINATTSFCGSEPQVEQMAQTSAAYAEGAFRSVVELGIEAGEFNPGLDAVAAGRLLYTTRPGQKVRAQAGAHPAAMRGTEAVALQTLMH